MTGDVEWSCAKCGATAEDDPLSPLIDETECSRCRGEGLVTSG